ncbi:MAG: portal protein [Candidatus Thorarchaeota archaeon]
MAKSQFKNLKDRYDKLTTTWNTYKPLWDRIGRFVGIGVDVDYKQQGGENNSSELSEHVNDPTAALSVMQAGDYMHGIMWGTGEKAITLEPSDQLLERVAEEDVREWFEYATAQTLFHMNHSQSGLNSALKSHNYDQFSFGTSGVGAFLNKEYISGISENALTMRSYGIDNIAIDEGKSGLIDVVFVTYNWRVNRIIEEFALDDEGTVDNRKLAKLPQKIQKDFESNNVNNIHKIIQAIEPREDFNPKLKGKRSTKFKGSWFMYTDSRHVFHREDFKVFPVPIARAIKVRGEVYGRASGTIILGSIASVDYMISQTFQILEKMQSPPLGTWNSAMFGDSVLDTSADGLTTFNQELMGSAKDPLFKIQDIGDPTGIINFLVPYLNEKITTAFKVDVLLDFNDSSNRTATEMMQRAIIRGKNLAGMLQQQKCELYDRLIERCISLLWMVKAFGLSEQEAPQNAIDMRLVNRTERIIPEAVMECEREGVQWFKIRYNGELDRLTKTEALEKIMTMLQSLGMMAQFFPQLVEAVNWYDMFVDVNKHLGISYFKSEDDFKAAIQAQAQQQMDMMQAETGKAEAQTQKDSASANKLNMEAQNNAE